MTNKEIDVVLRTAGGFAMGKVPVMTKGQRAALLAAGLIGTRGGLTMRGSIRTERLLAADEEKMFPL